MAQSYDSKIAYDWNGGYDSGASVPIVRPGFVTTLRVRTRAANAGQYETRTGWHAAQGSSLFIQFVDRTALETASELTALWVQPEKRSALNRFVIRRGLDIDRLLRSRWSAATPRETNLRLKLIDAQIQRQFVSRLPWHGSTAFAEETTVAWSDTAPKHDGVRLLWFGTTPRNILQRIRWRRGAQHATGYRLELPGDPDLPPGSAIIIPPLSVYYMTPAITLTRTSDGADLKPIDCKLALQAGAWAWSISATIPRQTLSLVDPNVNDDPVVVQAMISGYPANFIIETYTDNRKFGGTGATISGRGLSAFLSSTYAPLTTFTSNESKDMSQLAADLMPSDWTVTWSAPDWLVPAGLFTYAGLSPIDALAKLVNSIGAIILPDLQEKILTVQSLYPINPWNWSTSTPFASLPKEFVTAITGQWAGQFKSAFNGIWVSGQNGGVIGRVKRTGSDGSMLLQPQTDMLIVDAVAVRERGRIELAKADARKTETLYAPLLPAPASDSNPGIFVPGQLIEVTEPPATGSTSDSWFGQVMANEITATHSATPGSSLSVRQTLMIERHA